ncbi:MAG TPA: conjugal transfer protein [Tepidanaerobacteraceae bacterium]|nr:conjugal transfer protein [Tepidanaerobacteraceae bacterium]
MEDNTLKYAVKLAFLNQLLGKKLITDKEYTAIKNDLMKKHKIIAA